MSKVSRVEGFCQAHIYGVFVKHWSRGCMASCFYRTDGVRTLVSYPDVETQRLLDMFCGSCPDNPKEGKS